MKPSRHARLEGLTVVEKVDEAARREYMLSRIDEGCEVGRLLTGEKWRVHFKANKHLCQLDPHHIFSLGGRWDTPNNLLCITRCAHDYIHFIESVGGRIACMTAKLRTVSDVDACRKDWWKAWGRDAIGWLSGLKVKDVPISYRNYRAEILGMFDVAA